jgi:hypothetical protein
VAAAERSKTRRLLNAPALHEVFVLIALVIGTIALHRTVAGEVPSGPDGGNWLAMAQDRFLGLEVMSADVTYPPLLPLLLAGLLLVAEPLGALVTMALSAKCLIVIAIYLCARPMGRMYAVLGAALLATAGAQLEAYAWGAYPQLLGTALGFPAVYFALRYLDTTRRRYFLTAVALALLTYAGHTLVGGLLVLATPIAVGHHLWLTKSQREDWVRGLWTVVAVATPGGLLAVYNLVINPYPGVQPVLNPLSLDRIDSLLRTVSEAPVPWLVIAGLGVGALFFRKWSNRQSVTLSLGLAWALVGVIFFVLIAEPRALLLTQVGLILLALLCFQRLLETANSVGRTKREWLTRSSRNALIVLGVATFSAIVVGGVHSFVNSTDWYRVVDHAELRALDDLKDAADAGDLVIASQGPHGNQIGWWVQGYAGIPAYTGVDLRFLTFPEEREQARVANSFFANDSDETESRETLEAVGADFILVDRRGADAGWLESRFASELEAIVESPSIIVFRVPQP